MDIKINKSAGNGLSGMVQKLLLFVFYLAPVALGAQGEKVYKMIDRQGKVQFSGWLRLYSDTLVFRTDMEFGPKQKIALSNVATINGISPDSCILRKAAMPSVLSALSRMRGAQLGAFWSSMATTGLLVALPEAAVPIAISGGLVSAGLYLYSLSGIGLLERYKEIPLVEGF